MAAASCGNFDSEFFNKYTTQSYYLSRGASGNVYGPIQWDNIQLALKQVTFADGKVTDAVKKDIALKKQIWTSFEHKHLTKIQCVDLSQLPKMMFIVMEFAAGGSLYTTLQLLGSENKLPVGVVTVWVKQIAEGMLYLHTKNIVHRDLKSSNILLVKPFDVRNTHMTMNLKITDFDEVKELDHTTALSLVGTCAYMAPEVLVDQRFSKASDVWSFGVVIWEMLSGNIPYKGLKLGAIIHKAQVGKLDSLPIEQSFPESYRLFLKRCWKTTWTKRLNFQDVVCLLQRMAEGKDVTEILKYKRNMLQKYFRVTTNAEEKDLTETRKYKGNMLQKYFKVTPSGRLQLLFGRKEASPSTTIYMYDLPLEVLDIILQKSYLHWILNTPTKQRDEDVFRSLISVDVCFHRRITRQRFKNAIWRYLKNFYGKTTKRAAFIRDNRNYLLKTIQPSDEFVSTLLSLHCVTEEQCSFIQRQRSERKKNLVFLEIMRYFNVTMFSNFVKCLRQTNQTELARIVSTGGVAVKVTVINCGGKIAETAFTQLIHQRMNDLLNMINLKSDETNKSVRLLRNNDIEILNSEQKRQTVVVWIWCRTQAALEHIQSLYESNRMREVLFDTIQPSTSMVLNIGRNQFKKNAVHPMSIKINLTGRVEQQVDEFVYGVTKLRNEIFVLCYLSFRVPSVIRVFEDRYPFRLLGSIKIELIKRPIDIVSSEKLNCLYVSDSLGHCIWKITKEKGDEYKVMKWLTTGHEPSKISVSIDGNLLMVNYPLPILMIYGSDAAIVRSIQLPKDIERPMHAVETSIGNFIILHLWTKETEHWSDVGYHETKWVVSELTRDGQEVIRRFTPANKTQEMNYPYYISLNSDDRVFVADTMNDRVIILDSDLQWNQIISPPEEKFSPWRRLPHRLFYDKDNKQLIVGTYLPGFTIYTLSQN